MIRQSPLAITASYTYVRSRENVEGVPSDVVQTPRHSFGVVTMVENEDGRIGLEVYYTGRQRLEDNPYRRWVIHTSSLVCWLNVALAVSGCSLTART